MARQKMKNLTEPMFYCLLAMQSPMHGYAIMSKIKELTDGRVSIGPGTMYTLTARFVKEELIEKLPSDDGKNVYVLTSQGRCVLEQEISRLNTMIVDVEKFSE